MDRTARAQSLELGGWKIAEGLVQAGGVEPADVLDDRQLELGSRAPDAVGDELGLEAVDEALGHRVVEASPTEPMLARTPWSSSTLREVVAGVLRACIAVMHELDVSAGLASRQRQ